MNGVIALVCVISLNSIALQADDVTVVEDRPLTKCNFRRKTAVLRFESTFGGLGATYYVHLRLIGKYVVEFLLVLIKLFFVRCYG